MLSSVEHEILEAHNVISIKNNKKFDLFSGSDKPRKPFSMLVNNCWLFNIYEQEKFHAQLN